MILFEGCRTKICKSILKKRIKRRNRKVVARGLNQASSLGIIFDANKKEDVSLIKALLKELPGVKELSAIGYYSVKKVPHDYISDKSWYFFTPNECDFLFRPKGEYFDAFIEKKFDILLVLDNSNHTPIEWLAAMSLSGFKAGRSGYYDHVLDFMIELKEGGTERLLKELKHYLGNLNNQNA